ncbi:hypothetical protein [Nocardia jiangxiensis]|uniref:hypothetical protein n=1 Tax=Nocardia jiangxiensis TaxID=282685 RepID=UPI0002E1FC41|nr:hypothetical protein [Nocardia jiangxiensis]
MEIPEWAPLGSLPSAQMLGANLTAWWAWQRGCGAVALTRKHDVATLGAAVGESVAEFAIQIVHVLRDARTRRDSGGREMRVSTYIACPAVMAWLHGTVYVA